MTRQLDAVREQKQARYDTEILLAVEGELEAAVGHAGGVLSGFSVKLNGGDVLLTIRAEVAGSSQIAFVGAEDFGAVLRKVVREAKQDKLSWRSDRYGT